jgi:ABC-type uncharacterized transport system substrate-binding protein
MNPKFFWLITGILLALISRAEAQQPKKVPRIGFLGTVAKERIDAFRQGLRDLGWVEGQNITIDYRSEASQRDRLPDLAAELVRLKVDVIVTPGSVPPSLPAERLKPFPL